MVLTITKYDANGVSKGSIVFDKVTDFRHNVQRFAEAVPLPVDETTDAEAGALVYDSGGVKIEYSIAFVEHFSSETEMKSRYAIIDLFFSTIPIMGYVKIDFPEIGWSGRTGVLKGFELEFRGGEVNVIRGRISILGGKAVNELSV